MSSFLILHGIGIRRPPQHWQFQLAAELARQGHEVRYPGLPDPDEPVLEEWLEVLLDELVALAAGQRVVVCHSLACLLWFHAAARGLGSGPLADRVLLVSPPDSLQVPDEGASFRLDQIDDLAIRASARVELAIACSDSDPFNPTGAQAMYGDLLGVQATVFDGAGHITPDTGYGRWQFAEDWCSAIRNPLR